MSVNGWTIEVTRKASGMWSADAYAPGVPVEGLGTCGGSHHDLRVLLGTIADKQRVLTAGKLPTWKNLKPKQR